MARNVPERIKTKGGHSPRARIHAAWSPIGQKMRRTSLLRGLGAVVAVMLVIGLAADAYAQSFFDSLPSIQGLDSAAFAGDTVITDSTGTVVLADVGNHGDHRLAVKLQDVAPIMIQATVAIEDKTFWTNTGFDPLAIVSAALGFLAGLTGTGGGIFLTPVLLFCRWADIRQAAAVSALFIWVNSIAGLVGYFTKVRTIPSLGFVLAAAAIIGGIIGSHLGSRRFAVRVISLCLATVLVIAGIKLIFTR